ncbi:MAG TPA: EAL domain-containing protein, partial [Steroidobacteraceae bacterium]
SRRNWMQVCWMRFEALDSRTKASLDAGWKIFGRIFARQSLLDLSRQLDGMRRDLSHLEAREAVSDADRQAMAADEAAFAGTLERISKSLSRSQGQAWFTAMRTDLAALSSERAALLRSDEQQRQSNVDYAAGSAALRALLRTASVAGLAATPGGNGHSADAAGLEPTAAALAAPHGPAAVESAEPITTTSIQRTQPVQQVSIAWVSGAVLLLLGVICIGTTLRIVGPVRRMMRATRMLAQGALQTRVRRGGIKELDALATSFNVMAQQLAVAQEISRDHQHELETRIVQRTRELQHLAEHDALTELPNRQQLFAQLQAALDHAGANSCLVGVFILDLDNFKNLNDSIGHAYGDGVLQSVAQRLEQTVSSFGFSARLGGDEFTVVFERASDVQQIHAAGTRLMQAFQEPLLVDGRELLLSISVGASFYPDHAQNAEALLRAADAALFQAKQLGRNQLRVYSPELLEAAKSRFSTEQGLRHAIERGEFELAFQPEVHVGTFDVRMVEALLRWRRPHGMHASTTEFLAVAEESGLILEISDWVLHSAIQTAASWYHGKWPAVRMAINVSARQLLDRQFVDRIQGLLRTHRLPSHCIEIELTENVVQTGASTLEALHSLRDCGIGVALDDFGAGYSSIASLEQLPLTRVKLDRSLIAGIDSSARSLTITEAIIKLATGLGLEITAEGIERPQQLALLLKHDRLFLQGYLLSRAVPAQELPALLRTMSDRMQSLLLSIDAPAGRSAAPAVEPWSDAARSTG